LSKRERLRVVRSNHRGDWYLSNKVAIIRCIVNIILVITALGKLVFDSGESTEFSLERLIEEVGLELKSFATSAGLIMMKSILQAEEEFLAGERRTQTTKVSRDKIPAD
jgi:hypothetical protein